MSGDISPPGGSRLDAPARPRGSRGQTPVIRQPQRGQPSLARVAGTTLRLWWRRRVLHVPDGARIGRMRWAVLAAVVVVLAAGGAAVAAAGSRAAPPHKPVAQRPTPAQLQTRLNEQAASSWVEGQVAAGAMLACDPAMCGYLQDAGVPPADVVTFARGVAVPGGAALVLSTPALRTQSGPALAAGAPEAIASFGTGQDRVDVLVATASTAAAFLLQARHAQTLSARIGRSLDHDRRLHAGPVTRHELTSGMVDQRLLVVLQRMLAAHPVSVAAFGDADPGASWAAQLRSVTINALVRHAGKRRISDVSADLRLVHSLQAPDIASVEQTTLAGGAALVIQVPVPGSF